MISLKEFHENIWQMFFSSKKTLEEALEVYESMSIETKAIIAMMASKKDTGKVVKDKDGKESLELIIDADELAHFTLTCIQKEKEGWFDEKLSDVEKFNIFFDDNFHPEEESIEPNKENKKKK